MIEDNPSLLQLRALQAIGDSSGNTIVLGLPDSTAILPSRGEKGRASPPKREEGEEEA